jgi:hypothetical protein
MILAVRIEVEEIRREYMNGNFSYLFIFGWKSPHEESHVGGYFSGTKC